MKWEYLVLSVTEDGKYRRDIHGEREFLGSGSEQRPINELGQEGWELVAVVGPFAPTAVAFFKRAVGQDRR